MSSFQKMSAARALCIASLILLLKSNHIMAGDKSGYYSGAIDPPDNWKACKTDSECVKISLRCFDNCAPNSINMKFESDYNKNYKPKKCAENSSNILECPPQHGKTQCIKNKCTFVFDQVGKSTYESARSKTKGDE